MIVVGGVIPPQDYEALKKAGAAAIFPPGTVIAEAADALLDALDRRLGHGQGGGIAEYRCPRPASLGGWSPRRGFRRACGASP